MSAPTSIPSVVDFLGKQLPFNQLSDELLEVCAQSVDVLFCQQHNYLDVVDYHSPHLYLVRTGEYEIRDKHGRLIDRLAEGDQFGFPALMSGSRVQNKLIVLQEGLIYRIPEEAFQSVKAQSREFEIFYTKAYAARIAASAQKEQAISLTQAVGEIINREPVTVSGDQTIQQAAKAMTEAGVSSVMVIDAQSKLMGIITDRDLRSRVIADGLDYASNVKSIMTSDPETVSESAAMDEVLAAMLDKHVHHLPVMNQQQQLVGMVTTSDLVQMQISHPIYLLGRIKKANQLEQLKKCSTELNNVLLQQIRTGVRVKDAGQTLSRISDALTIRLIELAIDDLGESPMPFSWLAFGSQGRSEQSANSDQDNGIMLLDEPNQQEEKYFHSLAERVNQGLDECGFILCPGEVMAKTPKWCVSRGQWLGYFKHWINSPEPKSLMHASIFFDMRCVYGEVRQVEELQKQILNWSQDNGIFLALLCQNALKTQIPLGFFKQFVLEKNGEQKPALDLKHKGLAPVVDICRIYALASGVTQVNTIDRAQALPQRLISHKDVEDLIDAYLFIAKLRFEHQLWSWQNSKPADNYIEPQSLSGLQRQQLRDAFKIIESAQEAINLKFARGLF